MSWFGDTNPHFWSSNQPQTQAPAQPAGPSEPFQRPRQQPPETIQPGRRIRPRERPDHGQATPAPDHGQPFSGHDRAQPPLGPEPNPHFWPRDRRQAPVPLPNDLRRPTRDQDHHAPEAIQPDKRIRHKERPGYVQPGPILEPNPHFWTRDRPQGPMPPANPHKPTQYQDHHPSGAKQPDKRIHQKERPEYGQPLPILDPNPHFWARDQPQAQVPHTGSHRPAQRPSQHPTIDIQPEKRIRPKERPQKPPSQTSDGHHRPREQKQPPLPPIGLRWPTRQPGQQSRPLSQEPEVKPIPTFPTRQEDQLPLDPSQASQEHWSLHPEQASPEQSGQPHHQPKKQHPRMGPTKARPPRKHAPHEQLSKEQNLMYPPPSKTNPCTWCIAVFCVILWVLVILGGILILIVYLAYRPRNPHLVISNAALNAAYLDMGYLLNADIVLLVNFTNPNEKMNVDFNFAVLKVLYENQPIANQYIDSFSVPKLESKLATLEMVSSQTRLPVLVTQQLVKQIKNNRVTFQVEGYFHARSRLGGIFRYSYWLYSHCTIVTTGPPSGILVASKCITKR